MTDHIVRRVVLVDDSETARVLLRRIIDTDPRLEVVGEASTGAEGIAAAQALRPDIIVMDVVMPGMDGFEATRRIMSTMPTPIAIVTASLTPDEVDVSMEALSSGALVALQKPPGPAASDFEERAEYLRRMIWLMSSVGVAKRRFEGLHRSPVSKPQRSVNVPSIVAIATSTGGPGALRELLRPLPADFGVPIVIVQHIAPGFAAGLARWLDKEVAVQVKVGRAGERLEAGTAVLAPDDGHLGVGVGLLRVRQTAPINGFRPSADFLFDMVAKVYGISSVAVILTGMGTDGARGLQALHRAGGYILAQDAETSVVWSMPKAAVEAGIADEVLPIGQIGPRILDLVRG